MNVLVTWTNYSALFLHPLMKPVPQEFQSSSVMLGQVFGPSLTAVYTQSLDLFQITLDVTVTVNTNICPHKEDDHLKCYESVSLDIQRRMRCMVVYSVW